MANKFWVGGTGTWDASTTTHWSDTSGGAGGAVVPSGSDNVKFDSASGGGTVTVNTNYSGTGLLYVQSFTGTLDYSINNNNLTIAGFWGDGTGVRNIKLGSGTFNIDGSGFLLDATNLTFDAGTSTIKFSNSGGITCVFAGAGKTFYNLWNNTSGGGRVEITDSNTFNDLKVSNASVQSFDPSTTTTITSLTSTGGTLQRQGGSGTWTISATAGTIAVYSCTISNSIASGGATFNAYDSTNGGGNTGWNFVTLASPTVTTQAVSSVAGVTATGNGTVTSDGGATITERGVVWNITGTPTTSDNKGTSAGTTGAYTVSITGLTHNKTYYARAYAINSVGTSYGSEVSFLTLVMTNVSRPTSSMSNVTRITSSMANNAKINIGETWDSDSFTWATETRTWDDMQSLFTNIARP